MLYTSSIALRSLLSLKYMYFMVVLNKLNKIRSAKLVDTVRIFKLPMQQGFVRGVSKEYAEAKNEKEKIKLLNKNNPKTHLFFQATLSIGHGMAN